MCHKQISNSSIATAEHISLCLELAILLEVSAYPKPGNVHRTADFQHTRYEHFLASAVAVGPHLRRAAEQGQKIAQGEINLEDAEIGNIVKKAVTSVSLWQSNGNTLLGAILLLSPIAVAAGMLSTTFSLSQLRKNLSSIVRSTTPRDAADVYDAILIAQPSGLGSVPKLDVTDPDSKQTILDEQVTLFDVFKIASAYDSIAHEWVHDFPITFDLGHPYFVQQLQATHNINTATVHTYLRILSEIPDTFIARKVGATEAQRVSIDAKAVLDQGGLDTPAGRRLLKQLDKKLRDPEHTYNPGTTADIVEAVLAISILDGYRP